MFRLRSLINAAKGRSFSTTTTEAVSEGPKTYNGLMQFWHWSMAAGVLATFGTVQYKQSLGNPAKASEETKTNIGNAMFYHKSFGLLMAMMIAPRIATRMFSKIPKHLPGLAIEAKLARLSHFTTYGLLATMCCSGVGMGYFNGFGVPFFGVWKFPGAAKEDQDKDLAGF
jgi:cytochrome b561